MERAFFVEAKEKKAKKIIAVSSVDSPLTKKKFIEGANEMFLLYDAAKNTKNMEKKDFKTSTKISSLSFFVANMATSVRMHRSCPKYCLDLPPRALITPKIIRTIAPQEALTSSSSSSTTNTQEDGGNTITPGGDSAAAGAAGNFSEELKSYQFHANQVVPQLWLGSHADAFSGDELRQQGIFNVLNVAVECLTPEGLTATEAGKRPIRVKHVLLQDHSDEDISSYFDECSAFIYDAIENRHEGVLVHCRMGVSRSATIVIAYLMEHGRRYQQQQLQQCKGYLQQSNWSNLCSPMVLADHPDLFQASSNEAPFSCGVTPSTSASTSASSSPSITAEWLPYSDAFDIVKAARPEISPNLGFCIALRELDVRHGNMKEDSWEFACVSK